MKFFFLQLHRDMSGYEENYCIIYQDNPQTRVGLEDFLRRQRTLHADYGFNFIEIPASCVRRIYPTHNWNHKTYVVWDRPVPK